VRSSSIVTRDEGCEVIHYINFFSMNILGVQTVALSNFKSARPLLSTFLVRAARALLRPSFLEIGGVGIMTAKLG